MKKDLNKTNPIVRIRVTILLKREDGKLCFVRHLKDGKRYWLLPGGGQDPFEPAKVSAQRELQEELRVSTQDLKLLFVRESMSQEKGRHIQFLVFEGILPDFSNLSVGEDERVEGFDFFGPEEIASKPIFPAMKDEIIAYLDGKDIETFKTLEWIP